MAVLLQFAAIDLNNGFPKGYVLAAFPINKTPNVKETDEVSGGKLGWVRVPNANLGDAVIDALLSPLIVNDVQVSTRAQYLDVDAMGNVLFGESNTLTLQNLPILNVPIP